MATKNLLIGLTLLITQSLFAQQKEVYQRVQIFANPQQQTTIQRTYFIDEAFRDSETIITEISREQVNQMQADGIPLKVLIEDMEQFYANRLKETANYSEKSSSCFTQVPGDPSNFNLGTMGGYLTYEEILQELDDMAAAYPNIFKAKTQIGTFETHQNRPIYYVKISDNAQTDENEPRVLYNSHIHAREAITGMQLIYYMWYILENYATDPEIKYLVDNCEMYFIPVLNPDGFKRNQTNSPNGGGMQRKNMRNVGTTNPGVDLNRNFDIQWATSGVSTNVNNDTYPGPSAASEPETQAFKWFAEEKDFVASLSHHSYGNLLLFPFGYANVQTPDQTFFTNYTPEFVTENNFENTQSVNLYPAAGDTDDWLYTTSTNKPKVYAMTPESGSNSDGFWPAQNRILPMCRANRKMNLDLARFATKTAKIDEFGPIFISNINEHIRFNFYKFGIQSSNYTITLIPISPEISSVGTPITYSNPTQLQTITDSISYTLQPGITLGTNLTFVLQLDNGDLILTDTITKIFGTGNIAYTNDNSSIADYTSSGGNWATTTATYKSAPSSITDSPSGNYTSNLNKRIQLTNPISFTGANVVNAGLSFWARWNVEKGNDYVQIQASNDNGSTWTPLCGLYTTIGTSNQDAGKPVYDGVQTTWVEEQIDMSDYLGQDILIRFVLRTNGSQNRDGFYFDDLKITYMYSNLSVEQSIEQKLRLYPNPAGDQVYLEGLETGSEFRLINSVGQVLYSGLSQGDKTGINIQGLEPGYYVLKTKSGNIPFLKK